MINDWKEFLLMWNFQNSISTRNNRNRKSFCLWEVLLRTFIVHITKSDPSPPQTLFSLSKPQTQLIFGLDWSSFHWYDIFLSLFHAFHSYRPFLGFLKIWGFFKIDEVFAIFLGWVLFKWSYMFMHCITFAF